MPASDLSVRITDTYRRQLLTLRADTEATLLSMWNTTVDPDRLQETLSIWLRRATALLAGGQREAVRYADMYLAAYLTSELGQPVPIQGIDPNQYAGTTRDGRPIERVLATSLVATFLAVGSNTPVRRALDAGLVRAVRTFRTETVDASRRALTGLMAASDRIEGWRRITSGKPCGACLALASETRATDQDLMIHPACSCTAEPVVRGVTETIRRPSGAERFAELTVDEQDALFAGRGGATKADLIRSGDITLEDLVTVETHPDWPATIVETRLRHLTTR